MNKKVKSFEEMSVKDRRKQLYKTLGKDDLARPEEREPTLEELDLMRVIWSEEPMGFFDLCNALRIQGTCPQKGEKQEWAILFSRINVIEKLQWITCTRDGRSISTMQLTKLGADVVRNYADSKRELIQVIEEEEKEVFDSNKYRFDKNNPF